jgi:8-oxo-dGTP diphosphatase
MPVSDQGVFHHRYAIIPRTLIFLTRGEKILLIKGAPTKRLWANKYNGIGGHIEQGEDVLSAARRELAEETGLKSMDLRLCGTITVDTGENPGIGIYIFIGESATEELISSPEGVLAWISTETIQDYPLVEDLYILIPKILAMKKEDPPISGIYAYNDADELVIHFTE